MNQCEVHRWLSPIKRNNFGVDDPVVGANGLPRANGLTASEKIVVGDNDKKTRRRLGSTVRMGSEAIGVSGLTDPEQGDRSHAPKPKLHTLTRSERCVVRFFQNWTYPNDAVGPNLTVPPTKALQSALAWFVNSNRQRGRAVSHSAKLNFNLPPNLATRCLLRLDCRSGETG